MRVVRRGFDEVKEIKDKGVMAPANELRKSPDVPLLLKQLPGSATATGGWGIRPYSSAAAASECTSVETTGFQNGKALVSIPQHSSGSDTALAHIAME